MTSIKKSMQQPDFPMPDISAYTKRYAMEGTALAGVCADGLPLLLAAYTEENDLSTTRPVVIVSDDPAQREQLLKVLLRTWNENNDIPAMEWGPDELAANKGFVVERMVHDIAPQPVMVVVKDVDTFTQDVFELLWTLRSWAVIACILLVVTAGVPLDGFQPVTYVDGVWQLPEHGVTFFSWEL